LSTPNTISLIGMPGAGKSTVGVLLAKLTGLAFRDTDLDIQVLAGETLQQILERDGYQALRELEQKVLTSIELDRAVISTGGSAVYSEPAMQRLRAAGPVVYLAADLTTLQQRVSASPLRGIASNPEQRFEDIFAERTPLYQRYAHYTIDSSGRSADHVAADVLKAL